MSFTDIAPSSFLATILNISLHVPVESTFSNAFLVEHSVRKKGGLAGSVKSGKLLALESGNCKVTATVTPKKDKSTKYSTALKV